MLPRCICNIKCGGSSRHSVVSARRVSIRNDFLCDGVRRFDGISKPVQKRVALYAVAVLTARSNIFKRHRI
ncbi:MAG: hypothetical protein VYB05_13210 [Pseudomonadota bacterium]|nr:hypothetical protein [Pseudomonadota bacterium]